MTLGGISKASKGINLSEDIFGGFNFVLRGGKATQAEYVQVRRLLLCMRYVAVRIVVPAFLRGLQPGLRAVERLGIVFPTCTPRRCFCFVLFRVLSCPFVSGRTACG